MSLEDAIIDSTNVIIGSEINQIEHVFARSVTANQLNAEEVNTKAVNTNGFKFFRDKNNLFLRDEKTGKIKDILINELGIWYKIKDDDESIYLDSDLILNNNVFINGNIYSNINLNCNIDNEKIDLL